MASHIFSGFILQFLYYSKHNTLSFFVCFRFLSHFFGLQSCLFFSSSFYCIYLLYLVLSWMLEGFSPAQFTPFVLLNSFYPLLSLPVSLSTWPQFTGKLTSIASLLLFLSFARCSCAVLQANVCVRSTWSMREVCVWVCRWGQFMLSWGMFAVLYGGESFCVSLSFLSMSSISRQPSLLFLSFSFSFFTTCFCLALQVFLVFSLRLMYVCKMYRVGKEDSKQGEREGGCPSFAEKVEEELKFLQSQP